MISLPISDLQHVVERSHSAFSKLEGQKVLLTGGTGFFGTWIVRSWLQAQQAHPKLLPLTVLSRQPREIAGVQWIQGDIRDFKTSDHFDGVIHAATPASADLDLNNPYEMHSVIVEGARRIAQIDADRVLFTSSGAVYEGQSAYALGKKEAEKILKHAISARCFAFVGPGLPLDQHFAIGNFIRDGLAKKTIQVKGDGTPLRSYLYAGDLTVWLFKIFTDGIKGQAYDVGSDEAISIAELARKIATFAGVDFKIESTAPEVFNRNRYLPTISGTLDLGLEVYTSLDDAILKTMEYCRK